MPRGWLDDQFHAHTKRLESTLAADGLWARAVSFSCANLTDGFIPEAWIRQQTLGLSHRARKELLQVIVEARLFDRVDVGERVEVPPDAEFFGPGYLVHDFLDVNQSRVQVYDYRARERAKKAAGRAKQAQARLPWNGADVPGGSPGASLPNPAVNPNPTLNGGEG